MARTASPEHQASYLSVKKHHNVKKDSTTHESISEDFSAEEKMKLYRMKTASVPQNAIYEATFKEQLYSSNLLQLWMSGACTQRYEANELMRMIFKLQICMLTMMYYYFTGNSSECTEGEYALSKDRAVSLHVD